MTDQSTPTNGKIPASFGEAPASWNVKYLLQGFDCQLTIRGESGADLLPKTLKALEWIKANGGEPTRTAAPASQPNGQPAGEPPKLPDGSIDPTWCLVHNVAMKRHEKDGQVWWSHKVGDDYCRGKSK